MPRVGAAHVERVLRPRRADHAEVGEELLHDVEVRRPQAPVREVSHLDHGHAHASLCRLTSASSRKPRYACWMCDCCRKIDGGAVGHHAPLLQHVGAVGDLQRLRDVLLDEQDGHALGVDGADDLEHLRRRSPARGPSEGSSSSRRRGRAMSAAADGDHLLLAARERAGQLPPPLAQDREHARTRASSVSRARPRAPRRGSSPSRGSPPPTSA